MNNQIKMIIEFKKTKDEFIFEEIVISFQPLLLSFVKTIPNYYKEDMYQELLMELYKLINRFTIKKYEAEDKYDKIFKEKYEGLGYSGDREYEYSLFCNERQFISYLNKVLKGVSIDFYRKHQEEWSIKTISLNTMINELVELIDIVNDNTYENNSLLNKYGFTKEEEEFLDSFIEGRKIISEVKVAKKLGISQQAVNKKKRKIIKKYARK